MIKLIELKQALNILQNGGVGVMPTDTVYGLVARAADPVAVARLYALKHRDHKPGTVIAASVQQLIELGVPEEHLRRVERWWPGPLSVEASLGSNLNYLHQETGRQAFRVVADEGVRAILEHTGPLVTSSANQPGQPGAVNHHQAYDYFQDAVDFYVDGGDLSGRAPSTIIRVLPDKIEVIREGAVKIDTASGGGVKDCPFCLSNQLFTGDILAETHQAFLTTAQSSQSNYLIVPKTHAEAFGDLPVTWWSDVSELVTKIPELGANFNLSINVGKLSGQTVKHLHFWVIKRLADQAASGKGLARLIDEANQ